MDMDVGKETGRDADKMAYGIMGNGVADPASRTGGLWERLYAGECVALESAGPEDTHACGRMLGEGCRPGQVYCLTGDLGTGKTVFTQGFARGLGIREPVNSPTFTIQQVYEGGRMPFYHFDVYRIGDIQEMEEIGYEDCFYGDGVCLVEWGDLIREILPEPYLQVTLEKDLEKGYDYRKITIKQQPGQGAACRRGAGDV